MGIFPQLLLETAWDLLIINTGQCDAHTRHDFKCLDTIKIDESHLPPFFVPFNLDIFKQLTG